MKVIVNQQPKKEVVAVGIQGPSGPNSISMASDVNVTDVKDGSLLVYKSTTGKWTSTTILDSQNMEGGEY